MNESHRSVAHLDERQTYDISGATGRFETFQQEMDITDFYDH